MLLTPSNPRRPNLCNVILVVPSLIAATGFASEIDEGSKDWPSGNVNSAVVRLKAISQDDPNDTAARLLLGQIYLDNGGTATAERELDRERLNGAVDVEVLPALVESLVAQRKHSHVIELTEAGDTTEATEPYLLVVVGDRENSVAWNDRAMLIARDKPQKARDLAERALTQPPNDPFFKGGVGRAAPAAVQGSMTVNSARSYDPAGSSAAPNRAARPCYPGRIG